MDDAGIRRLADRIEITELLSRYADMVDRRDWPRMDRIFSGVSSTYRTGRSANASANTSGLSVKRMTSFTRPPVTAA